MKIRSKTLFLAFLIISCSPSEKKPEIETKTKKLEDTLQTQKPDGVQVEEPKATETTEIAPR